MTLAHLSPSGAHLSRCTQVHPAVDQLAFPMGVGARSGTQWFRFNTPVTKTTPNKGLQAQLNTTASGWRSISRSPDCVNIPYGPYVYMLQSRCSLVWPAGIVDA